MRDSLTNENVYGQANQQRVFLGVVKTIVGWLLFCGVGFVHCLFNHLYFVIC